MVKYKVIKAKAVKMKTNILFYNKNYKIYGS